MRSPGQHHEDGSAPSAQALLFGEGTPVEDWRRAFPEIVGRSPAMLRVLETVSKAARSECAVLILGESGTGKELFARAIHRLSARSDKPYVPINTSAIPDTLLESEFFGHEKGAFTSADRKRIGHFEAAAGGSIFLDEIGDMAQQLQAKLLRVLEDKRFTPLGGTDVRTANVRIIAATNKNLDQAVKQGAFRADLYYRLNVLPIHLPPLRERAGDVPELLEHFVELSNRMQRVQSPCWLADDVVELLATYRWPGNVRQLQNVVERLVVMKGGGAITRADLAPELLQSIDAGFVEQEASLPRAQPAVSSLTVPRPALGASERVPADFGERSLSQLPEDGIDLVKFIETLENDLILQALQRTGNNRNQAAKLLGLNRTTLVERIKKRKLGPLNEPSKEL